MTGSIALDVVIGLVFIFLLYSLLASIVQEILTNLFRLRGRNLRYAISRMFGEKSSGEGNLVNEFYKQPLIRHLSSGILWSKPSYINAPDFSHALMEILKTKGKEILSESLVKDKSDIKIIENTLVKIDEGSDLALSKQLHEILNKKEQRLSEEKGDEEFTDVEKIWTVLSSSTKKELINEDTKKHLKVLMDNSQNDLMKFRTSMESWYNNTMERASGWYRRTIQLTLLIIGFIIAALFQVNTIEITKLLSIDKEAREDLAQMATIYLEENEELTALFKDQDAKKDSLNIEPTPDNVSVSQAQYESNLEELLEVKSKLESNIEDANKILGFQPLEELEIIDSLFIKITPENEVYNNKNIAEFPEDILKSLDLDFQITSKHRIFKNKYITKFPSMYLAEKTADFYEINYNEMGKKKVPYLEFCDWSFFWSNWIGYFITALAISLGAPFWFDLLNKLIRIRSSIQSTSKNTTNNSNQQGNTSVNQRVG